MYAPTRAIRPTRANFPFKFSALIFLRNKFKRSAFFDMSDDLFYRISLIGFLVVFSSMVFFLTKYREKKVNNISQISITEQI